MEDFRLSFIVPVYNGEKYIDTFLENYLRSIREESNYNLELLFIDNGSNDKSKKYIKEWIGKNSTKKIYLYEFADIKSSYAARNFGVQKAKGDILVFTDIDCQLNSNYLNELKKLILNNQLSSSIIAGDVRLQIKSEHNIYEQYDKLFFLNMDNYFKVNIGVTANLVVPIDIFKKLNGFKIRTSGADGDFCKRANQYGFKVNTSKSLYVLHPTRKSYEEIKKKTFRIAEGKSEKMVEKEGSSIIKVLLSSIIQKHQVMTVLKNRNNIPTRILPKLLVISLHFGIIGRFHQIKKYFTNK